MSTSGAAESGSQPPSSIVGEKEKPLVTFNMNGAIIFNRNPFKARCLELAKTQIGIIHDDWRRVPMEKKDDVFRTLQNEFEFSPHQRDNILEQMGIQWKTWKKNIRRKYFGGSRESILALRDKVPEGVLVPLNAWNIFVDREATTKKLTQRSKAKDNRSKKTDAHYLGRTSYAQKEERWPKEKRKPDRVELYVEARKHPKTMEYHPGAIADLEKINEIRNSQDESSRESLETDALTQHFGKDKRGRTRGVGSTVARTKLKANLPVRSELEKVQAQVQSTNDIVGGIRTDLNMIMKYFQEKKSSSSTHESGGSHNHVVCPEKSLATQSPSTPSSGPSTCYKLMSIDGRRAIAIVTIVKTSVGAVVHNRPMLPYEIKLNVIKVLPGMENETLWQGSQGGADTIAETEGGFVVWPKHLVEEVVGDISLL